MSESTQRPTPNYAPDTANWVDDYKNDDERCYQRQCALCRLLFLGYKMRHLCKLCEMERHPSIKYLTAV